MRYFLHIRHTCYISDIRHLKACEKLIKIRARLKIKRIPQEDITCHIAKLDRTRYERYIARHKAVLGNFLAISGSPLVNRISGSFLSFCGRGVAVTRSDSGTRANSRLIYHLKLYNGCANGSPVTSALRTTPLTSAAPYTPPPVNYYYRLAIRSLF